MALANSTEVSSPEQAENHNLLVKIELDAQRAAEMVHRLQLFSTMSGRAADHLQAIDLNRAVPRFLKVPSDETVSGPTVRLKLAP